MKKPAYEQIQARKVKAKLPMRQHAQCVRASVTSPFFGVLRTLYYIWKNAMKRIV